MMNEIDYKGYSISVGLFAGLITVEYCGDEIAFDTVEEAKKFIDGIAC